MTTINAEQAEHADKNNAEKDRTSRFDAAPRSGVIGTSELSDLGGSALNVVGRYFLYRLMAGVRRRSPATQSSIIICRRGSSALATANR